MNRRKLFGFLFVAPLVPLSAEGSVRGKPVTKDQLVELLEESNRRMLQMINEDRIRRAYAPQPKSFEIDREERAIYREKFGPDRHF